MQYIASVFFRTGDRLDKWLDKYTSYRLVLYLLIIYLGSGAGLAAAHKLPFSAGALLVSSLVLLAAARVSNALFAFMFKVPRNSESDLITALILALIMTPSTGSHDLAVLALAAVVAMLSKYALTLRGRHLLNPAALGALLAGWLFHNYASWWIGTKWMAPLVAIGGLLIIRKVKRGQMAMIFAAVYVSYQTAYAPGEHLITYVWHLAITSPLLFLATVMLTEPLTSPTSLGSSQIYALVTGFLFSVRQLHLSPEEALLIGNCLTFVISPNRSLKLKYIGSRKEAEEIYSFYFEPSKRLRYKAGQYMEWTLPGVALDSRGNRRYLTLSSAPSEDTVAFCIRVPSNHSRFKQFLLDMKPGQEIAASQLAGDFCLPAGSGQKLVLVAGGVGVTPYRSMVKELVDKKQPADIHLLYAVDDKKQVAFADLFRTARNIGLKSHLVVGRPDSSWRGLSGRVDAALLAQTVPDYTERIFYVSGPQGFVASVRQHLLDLGLAPSRIVTDFFPGYS